MLDRFPGRGEASPARIWATPWKKSPCPHSPKNISMENFGGIKAGYRKKRESNNFIVSKSYTKQLAPARGANTIKLSNKFEHLTPIIEYHGIQPLSPKSARVRRGLTAIIKAGLFQPSSAGAIRLCRRESPRSGRSFCRSLRDAKREFGFRLAHDGAWARVQPVG
jgi:hypothetical protein